MKRPLIQVTTMTIPLIIGIMGRSRVGKDSIAEFIINEHPEYKIQRLSAPLKQAVKALYDFTSDQTETNEKEAIDERWNKTPRETIVSLTDYMMAYMGVDFFTKKLYHLYETKQISQHMIIPDIRYIHDVIEIQKRGGIVIKVLRSDASVVHEFEKNIEQFGGADHVIVNDGSLDDLRNKVKTLLGSIKS